MEPDAPSSRPAAPRIVVTVSVAARTSDPDLAARKNELYADGVRRAGGDPVLLDATAASATRRTTLDSMAGLLLTGGADLDPGRYGHALEGSTGMEPERDELEADAWRVAETQRLPVLGLCRGFQAINVFSGGTLRQHVDGHAGAPYGRGPALRHRIRLVPGTKLTRILVPTNLGGGAIEVNSYHHQAVGRTDLAPGLLASAVASGPDGEVVEGLEGRGDRFVVGVQCHPERLESTPPEFERLWRVFVDACRGPVRVR